MSRHPQAAASGGVPAAQQRRFEVMLRRPENRVCFDCDSRQPRWASTNLGVFFCLRCAGIHRSMGVHISKVKSTNMDAWEPQMMEFIEHIGNARGRTLYEYNMPDGARVKSYTDSQTAERLLRAKYERKQYYNPQFDSVLKHFLDTPIADDGSGDVSASTVVGPRQDKATPAPVAPPVMEDMWGAPVMSTTVTTPHTALGAPGSAPPTAMFSPPPPQTGSRTSVSELFAHDVPAGVYGGPAWGTPAAAPYGSTAGPFYSPPVSAPSAAARAHTQPPPSHPTGPGNSASPDFSFLLSGGGPTTAPTASTAPRANTDDLFLGGAKTSAREADRDILNLFDSAPPVGSGGGGPPAAVQGAYGNRAWEPQVVRPYYKPEW